MGMEYLELLMSLEKKYSLPANSLPGRSYITAGQLLDHLYEEIEKVGGDGSIMVDKKEVWVELRFQICCVIGGSMDPSSILRESRFNEDIHLE